MSKIHVLKFVPYFPPHIGGLESHVQEWSESWIKLGYGEVIIITSALGQETLDNEHNDGIIYNNIRIGYKINGYQVIILDTFDLIPGFPFPKFWTNRFKIVFSYLTSQILQFNKNHVIVNTHTRFFVNSLIGGLFAHLNGIKRIHIEHGVDFVKLDNKLKNLIAYLYDQIIGRYIFRSSDMVIGISVGCQKFVNKFSNKLVPVVHRGMNFNIHKNEKRLGKYNGHIVLGFVGRIVKLKGLDLLLETFAKLQNKHTNIYLGIVGDGEELANIKLMAKNLGVEHLITFYGVQERDYIANKFLPYVDVIVNPSYQEGLPTSVVEGLLSSCVVVATNVGGTSEISGLKDLILVNKGDASSLYEGLEYAINNLTSLKGLSYSYVKDHFDWNVSIEKYYSIYRDSLLGKKNIII